MRSSRVEAGAFGQHQVGVDPVRERPGDLFILELAAGNHLGAARHPFHADRPERHRHRDARPVFHAAGAVHHADPFPRRHQPLERTLPRVPVEQLGRRHRHGGSVDELFHQRRPEGRPLTPHRRAHRTYGRRLNPRQPGESQFCSYNASCAPIRWAVSISPMTGRSNLDAMRRYAWILDSLFELPVVKVRFGLDAIAGLVPGLGDLTTPIFSSYLLLQAFRMRVPKVVLLRMIFNVALDALVGLVPILGDLFDIGFKANMRNMALIERHADPFQKPTRGGLCVRVGHARDRRGARDAADRPVRDAAVFHRHPDVPSADLSLNARRRFRLRPPETPDRPGAARGARTVAAARRRSRAEPGQVTHQMMSDLPAWLRAGDLLVVNDTKVFPARLLGRRTPSGGAVECMLLERVTGEDGEPLWNALMHPGQKLKVGGRFICGRTQDAAGRRRTSARRSARPTSRVKSSAAARSATAPCGSWSEDGADVDSVIDRIGHLPLPPYIASSRFAGGRRALSDRLCPRARLGGGADGRTALHAGAVRAAGGARRRADGHHAARRLRHVQTGARRGRRGARRRRRALRDFRGHRRAHQRRPRRRPPRDRRRHDHDPRAGISGARGRRRP